MLRSAKLSARLRWSIGVDDEAEAAFGTAAVRRAHLGCLPHGRASAGAL